MDNKTIYEKFDWSSLKERHLKAKISKVIETIPDDVNSVIDIGCGNGVITNVLGQQFEITGVDRSEQALQMVSTKKLRASADNVPLPDHSFDMVFSSELLEHLDDETFEKSIAEVKRLSKRYIFITVPNNENPDKLSIQCPDCHYIYNSPNHLRKFKLSHFEDLFKDYNILKHFSFGTKVRYYNSKLLKIKKKISPSNSWIPYYWMPLEKRKTVCPNCENEFENEYRFNLLATVIDILNVIISPKKPYWLFVLMEKK